MSTPIAKPQLRGLHISQIKKNLIGMIIISTCAAYAFKVFVADRRKQKYADFYKYVTDVFKMLLLLVPILF